MSWQKRVLSLVKRLGPPGKFAARAVVAHLLPDNHAVVELLVEALDAVYQTPKKYWRLRKAASSRETKRDEKRLEQLLALLEEDLGELLLQVGEWATRPEIAVRVIESARTRDKSTRSALAQVVALASRFDRGRLRLASAGEHLTDFPLADGLRFGCWRLWIKRQEVGLLIHNPETGTFLRLWLGCNGWFEYRTNRMKPGKIFTVWSAGGRSLENDRHIYSLEGCGPPRWRIPEGRYLADEWDVEVHAATMTLTHPDTSRFLTFECDRPVWDCNDALWNEAGE
jgi:hypothetical protein